ncbi:MAG: TspO/MBR family protein [Burkholderiales bacterium]|nr:TspO/MBR family protein [Burkholderiales bacterium]
MTRGRLREALGLAGFLALCFAVAGAGGAVTATSVGGWYQGLEKPAFNPPDGVFAPVWSVLYAMIALAGWRVWRRCGWTRNGAPEPALVAWALQLGLNLCWSFVFFGARLIGAALVEIVLLLVAIAVTTGLFARIDRIAAWLMAPYAAWVAFAALLNAALWRLN